MFTFERSLLIEQFKQIIQRHVAQDVWQWLDQQITSQTAQRWNVAFAAIPRKTGKQQLNLSEDEIKQISQTRKNLRIQHWRIDQLARVYALLTLNADNADAYQQRIEALFPIAEMHELEALYSALPILAYPERWVNRCAEGIRSNVGAVLYAVICNNPYPSENLSESAWNQLVLKGFFTEQPMHEIIGLEERANQRLANTLSDFAHERWAAGRPTHPRMWQCMAPYLNETLFKDIERLSTSVETRDRQAAALVCQETSFAPAKDWLASQPSLQKIIASGITWDIFNA
jgi:hypothetical protein